MDINKKSPNKPTIKYSVDEDDYDEIGEYAKAKGFLTRANLSRVATFYYMNKNKRKK